MAYKVIILYQLYMPSYFLGTFTEYPFLNIGYRYQRESGFMFRAGISPSFNFGDKYGLRKTPLLYPYLSFGYTFK